MNIQEIRQAIQDFAQTPVDGAAKSVQALAKQTLRTVEKACLEVKEKAGKYPENTIRADVWLDGAALGPLAGWMAQLLQERGLYHLEENAHTLRCMAVLAVQSHYHHIVGPAMLARAECNERLGNHDLAVKLYRAVIADFTWIVDEWIDETESPNEEDRESLAYLSQAIERTLALQPQAGDALDLFRILAQCKTVLAHPT